MVFEILTWGHGRGEGEALHGTHHTLRLIWTQSGRRRNQKFVRGVELGSCQQQGEAHAGMARRACWRGMHMYWETCRAAYRLGKSMPYGMLIQGARVEANK